MKIRNMTDSSYDRRWPDDNSGSFVGLFPLDEQKYDVMTSHASYGIGMFSKIGSDSPRMVGETQRTTIETGLPARVIKVYPECRAGPARALGQVVTNGGPRVTFILLWRKAGVKNRVPNRD